MILRITEESTKGRRGESTLFYLREVPHVPGRTIQTTALTLDGAQWLAGRLTGVTKLEIPKTTTTA